MILLQTDEPWWVPALMWGAMFLLIIVPVAIGAVMIHRHNDNQWTTWTKKNGWTRGSDAVTHAMSRSWRRLRPPTHITGIAHRQRADGLRIDICNTWASTQKTTTEATAGTVVATHHPQAHFPDLQLWGMRFFRESDRETSGVSFESPQFNAAWRVVCADDRFAHDIVHARMMGFLMESMPPVARIVFTDQWIAVQATMPLLPSEVTKYLRLLDQVIDRLPTYIRADHGISRPAETKD